MGRTIVTTSHKPDNESVEIARQAAEILQAELVERDRLPFTRLREKYNAENVLVAARGQITIHTPSGECFFHPSMSVPRVKAIRQGRTDHMVEAMALKTGDYVLDCTLGLGADSVVAAFVVGESGKVVGVEAAAELAYLVKCGLAGYREGPKFLREVMPRIEVVHDNCEQYLLAQPENSFDIVYFDPMFRYSRRKSSSMEPLRGLVKPDPLNSRLIKEAFRVAKRRVVMKENSFSKEFAELGFTRVIGGRYSPVAFGVIDKQEAAR